VSDPVQTSNRFPVSGRAVSEKGRVNSRSWPLVAPVTVPAPTVWIVSGTGTLWAQDRESLGLLPAMEVASTSTGLVPGGIVVRVNDQVLVPAARIGLLVLR